MVFNYIGIKSFQKKKNKESAYLQKKGKYHTIMNLLEEKSMARDTASR